MKTYKERLQELPAPYNQQAIENTDDDILESDVTFFTASAIIGMILF